MPPPALQGRGRCLPSEASFQCPVEPNRWRAERDGPRLTDGARPGTVGFFQLGVSRPSVTLVMGALQRAGLVAYRRGDLAILDRAGLEAAACECCASRTLGGISSGSARSS